MDVVRLLFLRALDLLGSREGAADTKAPRTDWAPIARAAGAPARRLFDEKARRFDAPPDTPPAMVFWRDSSGWCPWCKSTWLLLEAMRGRAMDPAPTEDLGQGLRQGLVRALARLSEAALAPHVALLRGVMEREGAQKVQLEMIRLPAPILSQCSAVSWLADVLPK